MFSFCLSKVLTFQILSFQILTWICQITKSQNLDMHGHLWNADVYNLNPVLLFVCLNIIACFFIYCCLY